MRVFEAVITTDLFSLHITDKSYKPKLDISEYSDDDDDDDNETKNLYSASS